MPNFEGANPILVGTNIILCQYDEQPRDEKESTGNAHEYTIIWKVIVNNKDLVGKEVLRQCRVITAEAVPPANFDGVPKLRSSYLFLTSLDKTSFATDFSCELIDLADPLVWRITASYGPPGEAGPNLINNVPLSDDPLRWPVLSWIEYVEDQTVVEKAVCLSKLPSLERGLGHPLNEPGPIINAAGQQTVDPILEPKYRMILNVRVNYPNYTYAIALNNQFGKTVHAPAVMLIPDANEAIDPWMTHQYNQNELTGGTPLFLGSPHGTWKFLLAESERAEWALLDSEQAKEFCPTTIKLEFTLGELLLEFPVLSPLPPFFFPMIRFWSGWLKLVLNNGQVCFRKWLDKYTTQANLEHPGIEVWIPDPRYDNIPGLPFHKLQMPTMVQQIVEKFNLDYKDTRSLAELTEPRPFPKAIGDPVDPDDPDGDKVTDGDLEEVPSSEPINLKPDGTQITDPTEKPNHIHYANLSAANYYHITNAVGGRVFDSALNIPFFPLPVIPLPPI